MSLAHLHYTSAPPGPDGFGFRFTSVAETVPRQLLGEIEQIVGYEAPRTAPRRPTSAELADFPVTFAHTRLSDGSRLLCRSVYTGADHSGRYGNFHAHAVRLPDGETLPDGLLPIALWESPGWRTRTPHPGEPVTLPPGDRFDHTGLTAFAHARAARLPTFLTDVKALFDQAGPRQLILVEHNAHAVAQWVALACAALPPALARTLTFTTYTRRPDRARQHLVGTLPDPNLDLAAAATDPRYCVHDCTGGTSTQDHPDAWGGLAARIWLAGRPRLLTSAAILPGEGGAFDPDRLAAAAAAQGIPLDTTGRTASARWAARYGPEHDTAFSDALLTTLAAGGDPRTRGEWQALARLAARFPALATTPTAGSLRADLRGALDTVRVDEPDQVAALFALADALGVDTRQAHPALVDAAVAALHTTGARSAALTEVLRTRPELGREVVEAAERQAESGDDPVRLVVALHRAVPGADLTASPHLRMGELASAPTGEYRLRTFHRLLAAAGPEHLGDPAVLRTAHRLTWPGDGLTATEAGHLVNELPPDWLSASGIGPRLVAAALHAPATEPCAPALAADLLRHLPQSLTPKEHGALCLLVLAGRIADGTAEPGFTEAATAYCRACAPLDDGVAERIADTVARALLAAQPPRGELDLLAASGDEVLLTGYLNAGRSDAVRDRLRVSPAYAADCFLRWSAGAGLSPVWDRTRTALLTEVLRPAVRAATPGHLADITRELERAGAHRARDFEQWSRPGRLGRRVGGLFRRGARHEEGQDG
ncbi:GTPase-associated protein 1-related protein [Streptomyces galilaeus]